MSNPITTRVALEAAHEALIRQTYYDSVGVATWCVGMTNGTGHKVERYWNNPQPLQHCMDLYVWALDSYANVVREVFSDTVLTEAQFAAILSFTWNLGSGWLRRASWVSYFKNSDMEEAERRFLLFDSPPEIRERRQREADLLFRGVWHNDGTMTEYTRLTSQKTPVWRSAIKINVQQQIRVAINNNTPTQPEFIPFEPEREQQPTLSPDGISQPKPMRKSTTIWTVVAQFFGTAGAGVAAFFSDLDPMVAVTIVIALTLLGGAWVISERLKKNEEHGV